MDFMGIRLRDARIGDLSLKCTKRLRNALLINTHNHLRIMRIIACLSTVGFRAYGKQLIKLLGSVVETKPFSSLKDTFEAKWRIYDEDGKAAEMCFLKDKSLLNASNKIFESNALLDEIQQRIDSFHEQEPK